MASEWLGREVEIRGLTSSPEFNGAIGVVEAFDSEAGRFCVRVVGGR